MVEKKLVILAVNDRRKVIELLDVVAKLISFLRWNVVVMLIYFQSSKKANPIPRYYTSANRAHKVRLWYAYSA
jgi:hypothetical protein